MKDEYLELLKKTVWCKCSFCGAGNGKYDSELMQHRPRCFYKGDANRFDVSVPNYNKMIIEDDKTFLPMIMAENKVKSLESKLISAEKIIKEFREKEIK